MLWCTRVNKGIYSGIPGYIGYLLRGTRIHTVFTLVYPSTYDTRVPEYVWYILWGTRVRSVHTLVYPGTWVYLAHSGVPGYVRYIL